MQGNFRFPVTTEYTVGIALDTQVTSRCFIVEMSHVHRGPVPATMDGGGPVCGPARTLSNTESMGCHPPNVYYSDHQCNLNL